VTGRLYKLQLIRFKSLIFIESNCQNHSTNLITPLYSYQYWVTKAHKTNRNSFIETNSFGFSVHLTNATEYALSVVVSVHEVLSFGNVLFLLINFSLFVRHITSERIFSSSKINSEERDNNTRTMQSAEPLVFFNPKFWVLNLLFFLP
jgi:dipeptide/tripeptide permease